MQTTAIKLMTIIAEGVLEEKLINAIKSMGARGYTISQVRGHGTRGVTSSFWDGAQIKIETLVPAAVADLIFTHLAEEYFQDYAVVAYVETVEVARVEKYL